MALKCCFWWVGGGGIFQHAKKAMYDSLGLVDFAIGLVNPDLNLPKGQVENREKIQSTEEL